MKEANTYICGSPLFPDGSPLESTIVVREALLCGLPMETQYYISMLVHFPPVSFYSGLGEENNERT